MSIYLEIQGESQECCHWHRFQSNTWNWDLIDNWGGRAWARLVPRRMRPRAGREVGTLIDGWLTVLWRTILNQESRCLWPTSNPEIYKRYGQQFVTSFNLQPHCVRRNFLHLLSSLLALKTKLLPLFTGTYSDIIQALLNYKESGCLLEAMLNVELPTLRRQTPWPRVLRHKERRCLHSWRGWVAIPALYSLSLDVYLPH